MSAALVRAGKIAALLLSSVLVLLLVQLLTTPGAWEGSGLPWNRLLSALDGRPGTPVGDASGTDQDARIWPVRLDGVTVGVVVTTSAIGYRSRIDLAVILNADGDEIGIEILEHAESPFVARGLDRGIDGLTGATITRQGIAMASQRASAAGRRFLEAQL